VQVLSIAFAMISALAAAAATRDARRSRDAEWRDRWRQQKEQKLDALADAVVDVGAAAIRHGEAQNDSAQFAVAQMRLGRAILDALNPWINLEELHQLERGRPGEIDAGLIDAALNTIANSVDELRDQAFVTRRQRKRELKG
jgi:hypothetical protein